MDQDLPEALRLADWLDTYSMACDTEREAAAELRLQHAAIEQLAAELQLAKDAYDAEHAFGESWHEDAMGAIAERDALRAATTELLACLIEARDDVASELQRCRELAGRPSTDRRLKAQEELLERVDTAIRAAEVADTSKPPPKGKLLLTDGTDLVAEFSTKWGPPETHGAHAMWRRELAAVLDFVVSAERDCRTCRHFLGTQHCRSVLKCVAGSSYQRGGIVQLWETAPVEPGAVLGPNGSVEPGRSASARPRG